MGARRKAESVRSTLRNRLPYIKGQLERRVEDAVTEARTSISAYVELRERMAGREYLAPEFPSLPMPGTQPPYPDKPTITES